MKTLVIHPKDSSTDFLSVIYAGNDWTVINDPKVSDKILKEQIKAHDRIVMLGHGTDEGLIAMTTSYDYRWLVGSSLVYLLREKECVSIWCNADVFVKKSGMIVSEGNEANLYCIKSTSDEIEFSNVLFANSVKDAINAPNMLAEMKVKYDHDTNPIIDFNKKNLYENIAF